MVQVANEVPLTIVIDQQPLVTLMTLGSHPEALALGYLRNQLLIREVAEIESVQVYQETIQVNTHHGLPRGATKFAGMTGCSQGSALRDLRLETFKISAKIQPSAIYILLQSLSQHNQIYRQVGGVHGCALCQDTKILTFVEDVGRHNATDTIAGLMWLQSWPGEDKILYTTGRLTSEMVMKVAYLGIPTLISRSGITYRGIKVAEEIGMTIIASAKERHFLIFSGQQRLLFEP